MHDLAGLAHSCKLTVRPYRTVKPFQDISPCVTSSGFIVVCISQQAVHASLKLTASPYRAVKPFPVILLCVRLRLHRLVKRASRGSAASVMAEL